MDVPRCFYKNTYHHLYNRGINKSKIFLGDKDYFYFIRKMVEYKKKYQLKILCYCIMPNHFHLFVKQTTENGISEFIRDLINAYTRGTNHRYNKKGFLFEGKAKSKIIAEQEYFLWLCKYILNNPVSSGLVMNPEEWEYSSTKEYFGMKQSDITDTEEVLNKYKNITEFKSFINSSIKSFDYSILF